MTHTSHPPLAYVALCDPHERNAVLSTLTRAGWTSRAEPTGFHLLRAIADVIEGGQRDRSPDLIVIDAFSRGCAGTTIARGLRELGVPTPVVLVAPRGRAPEVAADPGTRVVEVGGAAHAIDAMLPLLRASQAALIGGDRKEIPNHELSRSIHEWSTLRVPPQLGSDASGR
jgi:hypothetical protein